MKQSVKRLYDGFKPHAYELEIVLDPELMKFEGTVKILGHKSGKPSQRLTFHQKELSITSATAVRHDKTGDLPIEIDRVNTQSSFDEIRLHSKNMMYPGSYTITLKFNGKITDQMNGIYPCYFKENGKEQKLIATQFESHHAREVFPCIDEPEAKATFDLTLITPNNDLTVLANTPVKSQESISNKTLIKTVFETTPVMSTYLLAFTYGNVTFKEARTARGTLVRTYATPENTPHTGFALETAVKCLEYYEDYFNIPYPLEKCDLIALPDFASGAMENWGLITFREQCLIVDPENTSLPTKQFVAMVVAHELAHQWFGNLVTMKWWTDLWLNEGFASWIEYLAIDTMFPDWEMWTQFVVDEQQAALKLDALNNTHPIEVPIKHPDEIRSIFDTISYSKGASVIHMLHGYLGAEPFRDGLRHYLTLHAYKNTDTADLWAAFEEISGKPVKSFMHAWTSNPGFPLLSIEQTNDKLKFKQNRFFIHPPKKQKEESWPIPLLAGETLPQTFESSTVDIELPALIPKINQYQSGFYRVKYDDTMIKFFSENIIKLSPLDRLGILADSFEVAKSGYSSVTDSLVLLRAYANETNSAVWDIIAANIGEIRRVMDDEDIRETIKPFVRDLTAPELKRLGWEERTNESHFDKLLRPLILGLASGADEPHVIAECVKRFSNMKSPADIPADLRGVIYTTVARNGIVTEFNRLLELHNATANSEERTVLAAALTSFKQPELIARSLELVTTKDVRKQDAMYWIAYSFMNHYAKNDTWKWLVKNWEWLDKNLGSDLSFYRTPIYSARCFSDDKFLKEYTEFYKEKNSPALERSIKQGTEMLEWQIAWKKRDLKDIKLFFNA